VSAIAIVPFQAGLATDFVRLNREWIERYFVLEAPDLAVFEDPHAAIVAPGGQIFFAVEGDSVLGTCAVLKLATGKMELAKMAVAPAAQGRGIGRLLGEAAIAFAKAAGATRLVLVSNSRLTPALTLYQRLGFHDAPLPDAYRYTRGDVYMTLDLDR
jgi:GNAT superfamily N-acetyltransferase